MENRVSSYPEAVIAIQVEDWERNGGNFTDAAHQICEALHRCGLVIIPAGKVHVEWAELWDTNYYRIINEAAARQLSSNPAHKIFHREVYMTHIGEWEPLDE